MPSRWVHLVGGGWDAVDWGEWRGRMSSEVKCRIEPVNHHGNCMTICSSTSAMHHQYHAVRLRFRRITIMLSIISHPFSVSVCWHRLRPDGGCGSNITTLLAKDCYVLVENNIRRVETSALFKSTEVALRSWRKRLLLIWFNREQQLRMKCHRFRGNMAYNRHSGDNNKNKSRRSGYY